MVAAERREARNKPNAALIGAASRDKASRRLRVVAEYLQAAAGG